MTKTHNLFGYGTLMLRSVQKRLFRKTLKQSPDVLPDYKTEKIRVDGKSYLAAVFSAGDEIHGSVLVVNEAILAKTDRYEGGYYIRMTVRLKSGRTAWTYILKK